MPGPPAEQIVAGVVLGERLAVTMYGAIHRARVANERNLRATLVDPKLLAEPAFRQALTAPGAIAKVMALAHPAIVPTLSVEDGGAEVVVVTRAASAADRGRYTTVQDLITAARANRSAHGKLAQPVAATIVRAVVEALAAAHAAGVVHGAVHPRSVLVDDEGNVRLGDFVVGRALTTAVANGADSALWRGLAGYLAPELVVGVDRTSGPTYACDVFAIGAMLFSTLSGEVPPGVLRSTPAVERLVHRALDTDPSRRYRTATDLLENLVEAFEDDRWVFASKQEIVKAAGFTMTDNNVDDATEDLLASLGSSPIAVVTRPSIDIQAESVAARHAQTPTTGNRLEALLADLEEKSEATQIDPHAYEGKRARTRDPISEIIKADPRRQEALLSTPARGVKRVPTFDDPEDDLEIPQDTARDNPVAPALAMGRSATDDEQAAMAALGLGPSQTGVRRSGDAALDALAGLDGSARRVSSAAEAAEQAALKLEQAAQRAEAAAARVSDSQPLRAPVASGSGGLALRTSLKHGPPKPLNPDGDIAALPSSAPRARPVVEPVPELDVKPPRIKSRIVGIVSLLVLVGGGVAFFVVYKDQKAANEATEKDRAAAKARAEAEEKRLIEAQIDAGSLVVTSNPGEAGVWLRLGRTPVTSMRLRADHTHDLAFVLDGHQLGEVQVGKSSWSGTGDQATAKASTTLVPVPKKLDPALRPEGKKGKPVRTTLPMQPTLTFAKLDQQGEGPIQIESSPSDAEVYLFVGVTGTMRFRQLTAGRDYEVVVVKDGYKPRHVTIKAEEWRDGGDPAVPIDIAKKKAVIEKSVELEPLNPGAPK